jgi:hypothetical protein
MNRSQNCEQHPKWTGSITALVLIRALFKREKLQCICWFAFLQYPFQTCKNGARLSCYIAVLIIWNSAENTLVYTDKELAAIEANTYLMKKMRHRSITCCLKITTKKLNPTCLTECL